MRGLLLLPLLLASTALAAAPASPVERVLDATGRVLIERGVDPGDPAIAYESHSILQGSAATDCPSTAYKKAGWTWTAPVALVTTAYPERILSAASTWDDRTSAPLLASLTSGSAGTAGTRDGVNQIDWVALGSGGTIAVTTTWYNRASRVAVESDARYNTYYAWATDGSATAMDVENIAVHELGHTFGLTHPKGKDVSCLTMYAYADLGETAKRTLGDGDVLGIQAVYGP